MPSPANNRTEAENERYMQALEREAARHILPPGGIEDEKSKQLKYDLHYCLSRNDWYFTAGGIVLGGLLSWMSASRKPFMAAVVLAPALDWSYGRHVCAEYEEAYKEYKKALREEYRQQLEEMKQQLRNSHGIHQSNLATSAATDRAQHA